MVHAVKSLETVTTSFEGSIAVIRFVSQPNGMISNKGAVLLADAIGPVLADAAIRGVIITGGVSDVFIRHANVAQIARAARALDAGETSPDAFLDAPFQRLVGMLDQARKPVIAAINGVFMGGGFEIALACTTRIAGAGVVAIGLPEIRIDIFPGAGGTQRLARLIGRHRARLFIIEGRVLNAKAALAAGVIDEIATDPLARAMELALGFAKRTPEAVAAVMDLTAEDDAAGLRHEAIAFAAILGVPGVRGRLEQFDALGEALDLLP